MDKEPANVDSVQHSVVEFVLAYFRQQAIPLMASPEFRRQLILAYVTGLRGGTELCRNSHGKKGVSQKTMDEINTDLDTEIARLKR